MAETTTDSDDGGCARLHPHPFDPLLTAVGEVVHCLPQIWQAHSQPPAPCTTEPMTDDSVWAPRLDVVEDSTSLIVNVILPGVRKVDVRVALDEGYLVIRAERKRKDGQSTDNENQAECSFGSFDERMPIPFDVTAEQIQGSFRDSVLKITVPKPATRARPEPSRIRIS